MQVREIITSKSWQDGSGWSCSTCISDKIIEVSEADLSEKDIDWSWVDTDFDMTDDDVQIVVQFYPVDYDGDADTAPLAEWCAWISELKEADDEA